MAGREVKLGPDGEVLVRGAMISAATWSGGAMQPRPSEWLATGDVAAIESTGNLRFVGRKSEVIVTAAGVNLHPEDLEAAIEQEPGVAACAVVAMETRSGPEPCAVLAMRGAEEHAAAAIERANQRLAEFQRVRRWVLWPEPDLPRTSTGKVRRRAVAEWLKGILEAGASGASGRGDAFGASADWLLKLISEISGETPHGVGDELRLSEDLQLDSLGRVQLAAALEERLGMTSESGLLEEVRTLGELRALVAGEEVADKRLSSPTLSSEKGEEDGAPNISVPSSQNSNDEGGQAVPIELAEQSSEESHERPIYPHWPWWKLFCWLRTAFIEAVMRPLVWLLASPKVVSPETPAGVEPMLIVANHVSAYDGPLILYALPRSVRRKMAVAMSGEMLEDYRHFRNPERKLGKKGFLLFGPAAWLLVTALFNVFPLPRRKDFQRSFAHAGEALDRGFHVLVFPEGTRSAAGELARFRGGIGLLVKQSGTAVLPVALRGLGELKAGQRGWFRSGSIEVRVGQPIRFAPEETESAITSRLHAEVERLLTGIRDQGSEIS
jgi:long-chain acyl-CoA synthetase